MRKHKTAPKGSIFEDDVMGAGGDGCRRLPLAPGPGEPVPSVPPVGKPDGSPLRYGGFWAASCTRSNHMKRDATAPKF